MIIKLTQFLLILSLLVLQGGKVFSQAIQPILEKFQNPGKGQVMVLAHRQDWKHFPENSLEALEGSIAQGVDIVEIDIRRTKDGQLIVMHDHTVDRTTNGQGAIAELDWPEISKLQLRDEEGNLTPYKVPTFIEYMQAAKGKIMVNLDIKIDPLENFSAMYQVLEATETLDQTFWVFDASYQAVKDTLKKYPEVIMCPKIGSHQQDPVGEYYAYVDNMELQTLFFRFKTEQDTLWTVVEDALNRGIKTYCHTLWEGSSAAGHSDYKSKDDPDFSWGWLIDQGMEIIMTDETEELIKYLEIRNQ
ncbi:glycerophosphoryl diester phosphodiesterase [Persicobacter diffluens]|uniref:Glycerophosphoryl diester phosphodiesterase n=1 Tax=Persicobacter diffluens TaxID=981 RepID=A0AAN5AJ68_9BACT|nr:glycerophosphoryl diester phosphodiesterase [Persicobacter diffluens]